MGFWEEKKKEELTMMSDEAIDLLQICFENISQLYENQFGRLPTILEWEQLLAFGLSADLNRVSQDIEGKEIAEVRVKVKNKVRSFLLREGTVLAIPLKRGTCYTYGIIKLNIKEGLYIDCYNLVTKEVISLLKFKEINPEYLLTIMTGQTSIVSGEWKAIGFIAGERNTYKIPNFSGKVMGKFYISEGSAIDTSCRIESDELTALKVKNPGGLFGSIAAQEYLEDIIYGN